MHSLAERGVSCVPLDSPSEVRRSRWVSATVLLLSGILTAATLTFPASEASAAEAARGVPTSVPGPPVPTDAPAQTPPSTGAPIAAPQTTSSLQGAADYSAAVVADNPISYWRLGETSGTVAQDEQSANPGTYAGGFTRGVPGVLPGNTATHLDGASGRVALGAPASLRPNNFTVEAWFRTSSSAGTQVVYRVRWYGMWLKVSGGRLEGVAYYGNLGTDYRSVYSPQFVNDGRWHHGVLTKDGASLALFVDGAAVASLPMTEATYYSPSNNTGVAIGRDGDFSGEYFSGDIDEVAVYNHALTASQVQGHFSLANPPPTGGAPTLGETRSHVNESEPWMCDCRGHHADPVDSATGTFAETIPDLAVPGRGFPLSFSHSYSSASAGLDGPLGFGWTHP